MFGDQHIFLQADIAVTGDDQARLDGVDLPGFEQVIGGITIAFPQWAEHTGAVMDSASQVVTGGIFILWVTSRSDDASGNRNRYTDL